MQRKKMREEEGRDRGRGAEFAAGKASRAWVKRPRWMGVGWYSSSTAGGLLVGWPVSSVSQEYPSLPGTLQTKYNRTGNGEGGYGTRPPSSVELLMSVSRHSWSSRRLPRSRTAWHWPLAAQTGSTWRRPLLRAHVDEAFVRVVVFSTRLITTSGALLIGRSGRLSVGVAFRYHLKTPLWQGAGSRISWFNARIHCVSSAESHREPSATVNTSWQG